MGRSKKIIYFFKKQKMACKILYEGPAFLPRDPALGPAWTRLCLLVYTTGC